MQRRRRSGLQAMMDIAPRLGLALSPSQLQLVTEALVAQPFHAVHILIARLGIWSEQAGTPFELTPAELALIVRALGELPYRRVHALIGSLQGQLRQIEAMHG
jgi:hypothetical protein